MRLLSRNKLTYIHDDGLAWRVYGPDAPRRDEAVVADRAASKPRFAVKAAILGTGGLPTLASPLPLPTRRRSSLEAS